MANEFEHTKPLKYSTVDQIEVLEGRGPWTTKSQAELMVLSALSIDEVLDFLTYDFKETEKMPEGFDIRGLRHYSVRGMPLDNIGGTEFHRIRQEIIIGLEGRTLWEFEDLNRSRRLITLNPRMGIKFSPFILHTYVVDEENSGILVVANTLFDPDDPRTQDTYSREIFTKLQQQ